MTLRTALRTSSNRAAVQLLEQRRHQERGRLRREAERRDAAERAVARARRERRHADVADGGVWRVCGSAASCDSPSSSGASRTRRQGALPGCGRTSHRAVSEATAFLMSSMLADVINAGTAYRARQTGFSLPAAGKTGTTNDYVDAWFVGFTPHLVTGVWIGFDQPSTIIANGYAGDLAVPVWASFMKMATKGDKPDWFERPSNIVAVERLPRVGEAAQRRMRSRRRRQSRRAPRKSVDDLHRVLREGHAANRAVPAPPVIVAHGSDRGRVRSRRLQQTRARRGCRPSPCPDRHGRCASRRQPRHPRSRSPLRSQRRTPLPRSAGSGREYSDGTTRSPIRTRIRIRRKRVTDNRFYRVLLGSTGFYEVRSRFYKVRSGFTVDTRRTQRTWNLERTPQNPVEPEEPCRTWF